MEKRVLILGNLQSGKTTLFRRLCGDSAHEVGIPESSRSLQQAVLGPKRRFGRPRAREDRTVLFDTPGIATLFPQGEEELMVRDALVRLRPSALLIVADAKNLNRALALVAHAAEFALPAVLALNMIDEAERRGIGIDHGLLESRLGIEVVPTIAPIGWGVDRLRSALERARVPRRFAAPASAEGALPLQLIVEEAFHAAADRLAAEAVTRAPAPVRWLDTLGRLAYHPVVGILIAAAVVIATYLWVGEIGATRVADALRAHLFDARLIPWSDRLVSHLPWPILREAIMDRDFGLLPTGLFLAFGLVMPVLVFFYFAFNWLVESGYLPRLSILLDRLFRVIGLNGKGILPLAMGFSCVTVALITTRMMESKKERIIAAILLLLGLPCAPLLAVMLIILAELPFTATLALFGVIGLQILAVGLLSNRLIPGLTPDFIMEIPPMRVPRLRSVLRLTVRQTYGFMKEAVPLFLLGSFLLFVFDRIGGLDLLRAASRPLVQTVLGLPAETVQVFIKTLIRRESGAAELAALRDGYTHLQLVVTLLVMTTMTPCINSLLVLVKEHGMRTAAALVAAISLYAVLVGALFNLACGALGVTFS